MTSAIRYRERNWYRHIVAIAMVMLLCSSPSFAKPSGHLDAKGFSALLHTVAKSWESNDARSAADCFTEDAVYIEPPDRQLYRGREALFQFFGGKEGHASPMGMDWHHIAFNPNEQLGFGEYTFTYRGRIRHGVAIVKIEAGKIRRWREYQYLTEKAWPDFIGESRFR